MKLQQIFLPLTVILFGVSVALADDQPSIDDLLAPPEVEAPGGPPPEDLCAREPKWNWEEEPLNPGLTTAEQFRVWAFTKADRNRGRDLFLLGLMHEYGQGLRKDENEATSFFEQAAKKGYARAHTRLGDIYCGRELYCLSALSYHSAALQESPEAHIRLSRLYRWGLGVFYDPVAAYQWALSARELDKGTTVLENFGYDQYIKSIEDLITDAEIVEGEVRAERWMKGFFPANVSCRQDEE
ncbi:MAG: tetratricopeptide repeat protein [Pseudomonadota bacterium]